MSSKLSLKKTSLTAAMKHSGRLVVLRAEDTLNHKLNPKITSLPSWVKLSPQKQKKGSLPSNCSSTLYPASTTH